MIYLASPYTDPDPKIMQRRYLAAEQVTAKYLAQKCWIYSPIVHCHNLALNYALPKDFEFWKEYNLDMLKRADELWVLVIPGWDKSKGVREEMRFWSAARGTAIKYV